MRIKPSLMLDGTSWAKAKAQSTGQSRGAGVQAG
jgi:hypothetical protein